MLNPLRSTLIVMLLAFAGIAPFSGQEATRNPTTSQSQLGDPWWKHAVIYEVYPRSFQDSNGDGVGDMNGITSRLDYLKDLGVDAIWITPMYPSPGIDYGYDISDYMDVHPNYGTLDEFRQFLDAAHDRGLQVMIELVINHTSDQHPWFQAALAATPGSPERARFWFRPGRGRDGATCLPGRLRNQAVDLHGRDRRG